MVKTVLAGFRLTAKFVTSRSGVAVPTKLGMMSLVASTTLAAIAGVLMTIGRRANASLIFLIGATPVWFTPPSGSVLVADPTVHQPFALGLTRS